jgi:hypothetical protein
VSKGVREGANEREGRKDGSARRLEESEERTVDQLRSVVNDPLDEALVLEVLDGSSGKGSVNLRRAREGGSISV